MSSFKAYITSESCSVEDLKRALLRHAKTDSESFIRILQHHQMTYDSTENLSLIKQPDLIFCEYAFDYSFATTVYNNRNGLIDYNIDVEKVCPSTVSTPTWLTDEMAESTLQVILLRNLRTPLKEMLTDQLYWPYSLIPSKNKYNRICDTCKDIFGSRYAHLGTQVQALELRPGPPVIASRVLGPYTLRKNHIPIKSIPDFEDPFETGSKPE